MPSTTVNTTAKHEKQNLNLVDLGTKDLCSIWFTWDIKEVIPCYKYGFSLTSIDNAARK